MNKSKNLNKIVNVLFYICLISILTLASSSSFIMLITIPILFAVIALDKGLKDFLIVLIGSFLVGLIFENIRSVTLFYIPILVLSLIEIILVKSKLSDKNQILINFLLASLVFIGVYKYQMITEGITIADMAKELKEVFAGNMQYDIADSVYERSFALYPSILAALAMVYSIFSLKIVRNYLAYKNKAVDMKNLNTIRIDKKDLTIMLISAVVIYFLLNMLIDVPSTYISSNLVCMVAIVLILNGIFTYDYLNMARSASLTRGMRWFFIIIFFYFFMVIFLLLGIADIFVDFRNKTRRIDAK